MIEIINRYTQAVIYRSEDSQSVREAMMLAVRSGANLKGAYLEGANLEGAYLKGANLEGANLEVAYLKGANLEGANLKGAYLEGANLEGAYLEGAYLEGANLEGAYLKGAYLKGANLEVAYLKGAYLKGANLEGANLKGAYLEGAYLEGANLEGANLKGANLKGANLEGANLKGAYLEGANLDPIKEDLFTVLDSAPAEVPGLLAALRAGKVDGSTYTGSCACLVGTLANVRGCDYTAIEGLQPDGDRPAERWFLMIEPGNTPENHGAAKISEEWILEWMAAHPAPTAGVAAE